MAPNMFLCYHLVVACLVGWASLTVIGRSLQLTSVSFLCGGLLGTSMIPTNSNVNRLLCAHRLGLSENASRTEQLRITGNISRDFNTFSGAYPLVIPCYNS